MDRREAIVSISTVLGYTITPASIISLSAGCGKTQVDDGWQPGYFAGEDAGFVGLLGETFLPRTETPGSFDVGAHVFVDGFLDQVAKVSDQDKCKQGLALWKTDYNQRTGNDLIKATSEELQKELTRLFDVGQDQQRSIKKMLSAGKPQDDQLSGQYYMYSFLMMFKRLIMLGYYASEQVGENILSYLPVPGRYEACIPAEEVGNVWALG
ncbi:MAG: twin-arginine translocation pathway signal protein [Cyclobacteriaceae bacterium]|nr:MAG: twin-arginine translocation pathway signal protein [Cyclobacteriaceae bacterium]